MVMLITPIPLAKYLGCIGCAIWGVIAIVCIYFSIKVEKQKKNLDVQAYKEIIALMNGKKLTNAEKFEEKGKKYSVCQKSPYPSSFAVQRIFIDYGDKS